LSGEHGPTTALGVPLDEGIRVTVASRRQLSAKYNVARELNCHQTPSLATTPRNCDHIATKPRVTDGDRWPTPTGETGR
jgi:hypothetical protein